MEQFYVKYMGEKCPVLHVFESGKLLIVLPSTNTLQVIMYMSCSYIPSEN